MTPKPSTVHRNGVTPIGALEAGFDDPYAEAERKAQGIFLALSVLDSVTGSPAQPMIVGMLREAEVSLPYLDYITRQSAGLASEVTPIQANVGANLGLGASLPGDGGVSLDVVGFQLVDAGISRMTSQKLTDYGDEYGVTFDSGISVEFSGLSVEAIGNSLGAVVGDYALQIQKEYIYDSATDQLLRVDLTMIGEGNPAFYTDVDKKQVSTICVIAGASLTPSLIEVIGEAETPADVDALWTSVPEIPCVVDVQDGSSASIVPELDIPGVPISIGLGLEVESLRDLVAQRHAFTLVAVATALIYLRSGQSGKRSLPLVVGIVGTMAILVIGPNIYWQSHGGMNPIPSIIFGIVLALVMILPSLINHLKNPDRALAA